MGEAIKSSAGDASVNVEVYDKKWIKQQGMGGILGVAKGSDQSPYFVEISYVVSINLLLISNTLLKTCVLFVFRHVLNTCGATISLRVSLS